MPIKSVVADLIKAGNQWEEDKLKQYFIQEGIEVILNIPLPKEKAVDKVMWHFDKKEDYSVKSEYQLVLKLKYPKASTSSSNNPRIWKTLWSI